MNSICFGIGEKGQDVSRHIKSTGDFLLGPQYSSAPVKCMKHNLARRKTTNKFYNLKIVTIKNPGESETLEDQQGKILLHTEYSLLSELKGQKGIVQQHGIFRDTAPEEIEINGKIVKTGKNVTRIVLVLDCYNPHDFHPSYTKLINLQSLVLKEKKLKEQVAVDIFYKIVQIVESLHEQNIVHRDLKLGNVTIHKETKEVTLTNFCLGKKLSHEDQLLVDQRGSPAYISPDVICGKPYLGKPSDMWALGVVLYTMLYGQFPFFDPVPTELFRKIKAAEYNVPMEPYVSTPIVNIMKSLLQQNPEQRLSASGVLEILRDYRKFRYSSLVDCDLQVVPVCSSRSSLKRSLTKTNEETSEDVDDDEINPYQSGKHRTKDFYAVEALLASAPSQMDEKSIDEEEKSSSGSGSGGDNDEEGVHEPPRKITKITAPRGTSIQTTKIVRVKEDARILTVADLEKLYAIYQANKQKLAAEQAAAASSSSPTEAGPASAASSSSSISHNRISAGTTNTSSASSSPSSSSRSSPLVNRSVLRPVC